MSMHLYKSPALGDAIFDKITKGTVWYSTLEAAHFLGISENALRILVCRRKVRFYKMGSRLKFSKSDLDKLIKKGK